MKVSDYLNTWKFQISEAKQVMQFEGNRLLTLNKENISDKLIFD